MVLCSSWGRQGHQSISGKAGIWLPAEMQALLSWSSELSLHAPDPDDRKSGDPTEGAKHYIDIDNYPEFIANNKIDPNYSTNIASHGESFVKNNGILPWATLASYDSLVSNFKHRNLNKIILYASDLGHYVADGHIPLHITANYDGQMTNQKGIHSRYESTMIGKYLSEIAYTQHGRKQIINTKEFVFNYIYANYKYVDSMLIADKAATSEAGSNSSTNYYTKLWLKTRKWTSKLFSESANNLADLIYTAWLEAGSPTLQTTDIYSNENQVFNWKIYPNPTKGRFRIKAEFIGSKDKVMVKLIDFTGKCVYTQVVDSTENDFELKLPEYLKGIIFVQIITSQNISSKKLLIN
jgi:hypothetical protein